VKFVHDVPIAGRYRSTATQGAEGITAMRVSNAGVVIAARDVGSWVVVPWSNVVMFHSPDEIA
jgi:hypothetical protein